uniref:Uncharacterized protein n=1 Tax=Trypanosoma congolense (strain IL3000) TaxID=1068625 RepID=G0UPU4_TRYCI|nr:hypothetical protein, unlikely [Trypanosoma congolense IL3000]
MLMCRPHGALTPGARCGRASSHFVISIFCFLFLFFPFLFPPRLLLHCAHWGCPLVCTVWVGPMISSFCPVFVLVLRSSPCPAVCVSVCLSVPLGNVFLRAACIHWACCSSTSLTAACSCSLPF